MAVRRGNGEGETDGAQSPFTKLGGTFNFFERVGRKNKANRRGSFSRERISLMDGQVGLLKAAR